jgi:hypothetical protein
MKRRFYQGAKSSLILILAPPYRLHSRTAKLREINHDMQRTNNVNVDAAMRSFEDPTKAILAIATEIADYTKRSFEDGTKTMENLLGAKSLDKAFEVQTEYAKAAYESYVSEVTKLGELYSDLAREAFKPYQSFVAKVTPTK